MKPSVALLIATAVTAASQLRAQPQPPTPITFEVASIRLHKTDVQMVGMSTSGPRVRVSAFSLTNLIGEAYHLERYQMSGTQSWMDSNRYDIIANAPGDAAPTGRDLRLMFQDLLADRFHLKVHMQTKELPTYALVVSKNGPKLKTSTADEYSQTASGSRTLT